MATNSPQWDASDFLERQQKVLAEFYMRLSGVAREAATARDLAAKLLEETNRALDVVHGKAVSNERA